MHTVRTLSKARHKILELLESGPCTVSSLALRTGQHENTIRAHLDALVDADLAIKYQFSEHARGRPAWLYRTPPASEPMGAGEYAGLAMALAGMIAHTSAHPVKDALQAGRTWASELVKNSKLEKDGTSKKKAITIRRKAVSLLNELGFAPREEANFTRIKLTRCPLLDVARQNPEIVCNVHLGLVQGVLREIGAEKTSIAKVDLIPFSEPGACLLKI